MARFPVGAVYLLHFDRPYKHAQHYLGYTERDPEERLKEHLAGRGNPLVRAAVQAGIEVSVVRVWENETRSFERDLKNLKNTPLKCPVCREGRQSERQRRRREREASC